MCHEVISSKETFLRGGEDETFVFPREKTCQFTHTRLSFNRSLNWVNNRKLPCKKDSVWQEEQSWLKGFLPPRAVLQSCKKRRNVFSFVSCHYFYSSHFFCFHLWYEHEKEALTHSVWKITHHVSFEFLFTPLVLYSVQTFEFCWPCCKMRLFLWFSNSVGENLFIEPPEESGDAKMLTWVKPLQCFMSHEEL